MKMSVGPECMQQHRTPQCFASFSASAMNCLILSNLSQSSVMCDEEWKNKTHNFSSSLHISFSFNKHVYTEACTYLEPALNFTASLTCSMVVGFVVASFFPPIAAMVPKMVAPMVPSARYSFLMARPKITLHDHMLTRLKEMTATCRGSTAKVVEIGVMKTIQSVTSLQEKLG
jgi:hypothetical protein